MAKAEKESKAEARKEAKMTPAQRAAFEKTDRGSGKKAR